MLSVLGGLLHEMFDVRTYGGPRFFRYGILIAIVLPCGTDQSSLRIS